MISLNSLFSGKPVFQRRKLIPVWGHASPGATIKIELEKDFVTAIAASDGFFIGRLPAREAGGPFTLKVTDTSNGETIAVPDILVGEVWLAGGQSNMEYPMRGSDAQLKEFVQQGLENDRIRMYTAKRPRLPITECDAQGTWQTARGKDIEEFSAVALWFADKLCRTLQIPVGIIHSSYGGTIAEAWTSRGALLSNPVTAELPEAAEEYFHVPPESVASLVKKTAAFDEKKFVEQNGIPDPGNKGFEQGWARPDFQDSDWENFKVPGSWICGGKRNNSIVWIRKKVILPSSFAGKNLILHLGPIDKIDVTYFNGVEVGRTGRGFDMGCYMKNRDYAIPAELVQEGENVIAVRADSALFDGSFGGSSYSYSVENPENGSKIYFAGECRLKIEFDRGQYFAYPSGDCQRNMLDPNLPSVLFNCQIKPLLPYGIQGCIWYQGESNAHSVEKSLNYRSILRTMIQDWRLHFEQGNFPFVQVQLAGYMSEAEYDDASPWATLRQSQIDVTKDLPNVGIITAVDRGEVDNIHPKDKRTVGYRLADWALNRVYGKNNLPCGPLAREIRREGNTLRVFFDYCGNGLVLKGTEGFFLADENGEFCSAQVRIEDDTLVLSSESITVPCHVRYGWAKNPSRLTLWREDGEPALPFGF